MPALPFLILTVQSYGVVGRTPRFYVIVYVIVYVIAKAKIFCVLMQKMFGVVV